MRGFFRLVAILLLAAAAWLVWALMIPVQATTQSVLLRPGSSSRHIAADLKQAGAVRSSLAFLLLHYVKLRNLKAGEYLFDHPQNALTVYDRLARGDIYFHTVTVPEGFNQFDIGGAIEAA